METVVWVFWSLWVGQGLFCVFNIWSYPRRAARQDIECERARTQGQRSAVVIVPVKGVSKLSRQSVRLLFEQDYPSYRVLFCFESNDDPAAVLLRDELNLGPQSYSYRPPAIVEGQPGPREVLLVTAGHAEACGQKVHNQLAAMRALEDADELIAFADADMLAGGNWLSRLLSPLNVGSHHAAGGYRWFVPESSTLVNGFASVINASVATLGGREAANMLWGGSMAITREAFQKIDVPNLFAGSLNDDLQLSRGVRRAGYRIAFIRSLLVPSPVDFTWNTVVEFVRRQYFQVRHYTPKLYALSLLGTGFYSLNWFGTLIAGLAGFPAAWIPWVFVTLGLDQARALLRFRLARILYDNEQVEKLRPARVHEHLATPAWMALHFALAASALTMKTVTWAGITYRVRGRQETEIVSRSRSADRAG